MVQSSDLMQRCRRWQRAPTEMRGDMCSFGRALHRFAAEAGHRRIMQSLFSQIIIGVIVTVIGTLVTDAITGGHVSRHFGAPGFHSRH